ncbi:MAG TPA: hypothetical protein VJ982_04740 [Gemmatimonadota bacterium]|nr:hypothetical protein [Gemmatimonadota bacterium]
MFAGAASVLSVRLRQHVPITPYGGRVDDLLFIRGATFLARGQWLGPFDELTLAKGPGYPLFIELMYRHNLALKVGEQLTYLFAVAALACCAWIVSRRKAAALVVFVVLALDPVNFSAYNSQIIRDGWYASLSTLFVATLFLALYGAATHVRLFWPIALCLVAGVSGGAFWLCREEGAWIVPTILFVAMGLPFCLLVRWWTAKPRTRLDRTRVLRKGGRIALVLGLAGVALITPIAAVTRENSRHYGAPLTNDLASGQFARAYADWTRVEAGTPSTAAPLVRSQREAVYRVSSAARQLEPYLENPDSRWLRASCRILEPCGDLAGNLVIWAMRDAAANAGHFRSGSDAQRFFGELDAQIQSACASAQLSCSARLPTELQSLQRVSGGPLFTYLRRWAGMTIASIGLYDPPNELRPIRSDRWALYTQIVRGLPASQSAAADQLSRFTANTWPYRILSRMYRLLLPCLLVLATIGFVLSIARPRWPQSALSVLSGAFVVGAMSRLLFVALLDTTQFPTAGSDIRLLLPAHAFLIAFGAVGTVQFADALLERIRPGRGGQPS